jgi:hypothetical protein
VLQDVLANLDDLASLLHEGAALAVELGGPAPAIEERRAELLLQVPDLEADGRLGQPDRVRRRGKASIVVDRDQGSQLAQFHVSSRHCRRKMLVSIRPET